MGAPKDHISPIRLYLFIFLALIFLTGLTVGASYINLGGAGNIILGLIIAIVKASLVALFFMHLRYDAPQDISIKYFAIFPVCLFLLVVMSNFPDTGFRLSDQKPMPIEKRIDRPPAPEGH